MASPSLLRLISHLVNETLEGRGGLLKEYALGTDVFDRGETFDPKIDTIVRVQARRLRAKLEEYYRTEGSMDPVVIHLRAGSYIPRFDCRIPELPPPATRVEVRGSSAAGYPSWLPGVVAALILVGVGSATLWTLRARPMASPAGASGSAPEPVREGTRHVPGAKAHEAYLQAKYAFDRGTRESLAESVRLFRTAISLDPDYSAAHAGLAYAYLMQSSIYAAPSAVMPHAKQAALGALNADDTLVEAYTALGTVALFYDWDWVAAEADINHALTLNRDSAPAHELRSQLRMAQGRFDEALAEIRLAQLSDPTSPMLEYDTAWTLIAAKRYRESIDASRRALQKDANFSLARASLGLALVLDGHSEDGIAELERVSKQEDSSILDLFLVHGYALSGRADDARRLLAQVEASETRRYVCAYEVGSAHAVLGDATDAFAWLSRALNQRSDCIVWLRVEPWLETLRADARFGAFTARIVASVPAPVPGQMVR